MRLICGVALALLCGAANLPTTAHADAIRAPAECPEPGWVTRRVGHGGWCFPRDCQTDAECPGGGSCEEVARCFTQSTYSAGRRRFEPGEERPTRARPGERCNANGTCGPDLNGRPPPPNMPTCETNRECVYGPEFALDAPWDRGETTPPPRRLQPAPEPAMTEAPMTEAPMTETAMNETAMNEASSGSASAETESSSCAASGAGGGGALGLIGMLWFAARRRR